MPDTERGKPWWRREPHPSIVAMLLDHELISEGGNEALHLATRIVAAEEASERDPVAAVAATLVDEHLVADIPAGLDAAQDIVDVLVEWRAPREDGDRGR